MIQTEDWDLGKSVISLLSALIDESEEQFVELARRRGVPREERTVRSTELCAVELRAHLLIGRGHVGCLLG